MYTLLRGRLPSQTNFQVPITLISALDLAERTYQIPSAPPHAAPGPFLSPGLSAPLLGGSAAALSTNANYACSTALLFSA